MIDFNRQMEKFEQQYQYDKQFTLEEVINGLKEKIKLCDSQLKEMVTEHNTSTTESRWYICEYGYGTFVKMKRLKQMLRQLEDYQSGIERQETKESREKKNFWTGVDWDEYEKEKQKEE